MNKIDIRGIMIADVTMDEAVSFISSRLKDKICTSVFTPNSEIAQLAIDDPALSEALNRCDIAVPDGVGIVKASRILGCPLREKVAGVELGMRVLAVAEKCGYSVFLYGGKVGIAETAAERLTNKFPKLKIAGCLNGYKKDNDAVIRKINSSGADILFVCLGAPKQELWIDRNKNKLSKVSLFLGLGGSLDVYAGAVKRAPRIFIKLNLEWLWRLMVQPKRIFRMTALPRFYFGTWIYRFKR